MPITGFKKGDRVLTPAGRPGTVARVNRLSVNVLIDGPPKPYHKNFRQAALRYARPPEPAGRELALRDAKVRLVNANRGRGREYRADLEIDGEIVGRVERGWNMGGRRANEYVAKVGLVTVAEAPTLRDLLAEIRETPKVELDVAMGL